MRKIKETVYQRLVAQVDELQERGLTKLASSIESAINEDVTFDDGSDYSYDQLSEEVNTDLWKAATRFIRYYNLDHADVEKVQRAILEVNKKLASELESALEVDLKSKTLEPKLPGEDK